MSFEEAMEKSLLLKLDVLEAIALKLPEKERKRRLSAYIQFNPYMVPLKEFKPS